MQIITVIAFATAILGVSAAPKSRRTDGGLECCNKGGKWYWGWDGADESEEYICATGGLVNVLNCVSVLDGSTVDVPISLLIDIL